MVTRKRTPRKTTEEIENTVAEEVETVEEVKPKTTRTKKVEKSEPTTEELMKQIAELQKALLEQKAQPIEEAKPNRRKVRKELPKIDLNELIPVISRNEGELFYKSTKTQQEVFWKAYGDLQHITFDEILNMRASQPRFIDDAWVVVDDDEVIEYLGLADKYDQFFHIEDMDAYLLNNTLDELKKEIPVLPSGLKTSIGVAAKRLVESEELYHMGKIKLLEDKLGICLINF